MSKYELKLMLNKLPILLVFVFCSSVFSYQEGIAKNDDIEIAYRDYGPIDGRPILLITGLGAQLTLWPQFLIEDLQANNFRPIVFDNRDVGLSTRFSSQPSQVINYLKYFLFLPINSEYTIEDMAADGLAVLDHLKIDSAHILGMSMGGMISQVLVAQNQNRVKSFTMISSTASTPNPFNGPKFKVTQQLLKRTAAKDDIENRIDQSIKLFEMIGTPGKNYDTPQFRNNMRAYIKRGGDDGGFLRQMAAITGSKNRRELLKSINSPTLIIHGNIDPLIKVKNAVAANKLIKSSELQIIDGMGHLLDEEAYAKFQKSFMVFLREHS